MLPEGATMDAAHENQPAQKRTVTEFFNKFRGDSLINDGQWLESYSTAEILNAVDDIALGALGKRVLQSAARLAWRERRLPIAYWERFVPDEFEQKFERELLKNYERYQEAKMKRAQIDRIESLTGRANTIPFPKTERLPKAPLKKVGTA